MLFKAMVFSLIYSTLSSSVNVFSNKFCDNSSISQMIDRVFQTKNTIYVIRNSFVYPIIRKEMPLIVGTNSFWIQKSEAYHINDLFLGIDLTDFETGFTITLDENKDFVRDYKHEPNYYYLTFIFSGHNYYLFKELSNNSFVLANNEEIPLNLKNQGSIKQVFGIEGPIYVSLYKVFRISFERLKKSFKFVAVLLSANKMLYSYVLHNDNEVKTELKKERSIQVTINRAQDIMGIVSTNIPYIVFNNSLIEFNNIQSIGLIYKKGLSIWEAFDCDYFSDYLPQIEEIYKPVTTWSGTTPESTVTVIKPRETSYWPTIVLTIIFLFFGFVIFLPLLAFRKIKKKSNQNYMSKGGRKVMKDTKAMI